MAGIARKVLHFPCFRSNLSLYPFLSADAIEESGARNTIFFTVARGLSVSDYGVLAG